MLTYCHCLWENINLWEIGTISCQKFTHNLNIGDSGRKLPYITTEPLRNGRKGRHSQVGREEIPGMQGRDSLVCKEGTPVWQQWLHVVALEQHFYRTDPDCLTARIPLPEFDLYISTVLPLENKGILWVHCLLSLTQSLIYQLDLNISSLLMYG